MTENHASHLDELLVEASKEIVPGKKVNIDPPEALESLKLLVVYNNENLPDFTDIMDMIMRWDNLGGAERLAIIKRANEVRMISPVITSCRKEGLFYTITVTDKATGKFMTSIKYAEGVPAFELKMWNGTSCNLGLGDLMRPGGLRRMGK